MELRLSAEEQELLAEILRHSQRELLLEISHADHHAFKVTLQHRADALERLLQKVVVARAA